MTEETDKPKEKSAFESTKEDYAKVRTHQERSEGLAYRGDISQLYGNVLGEFKSDYFRGDIKKEDLEGYVNGAAEYKQTNNIDGLLNAGGLAFQANAQYEGERFKSNFDGKNLENLLGSSPDEVLLGIANQSYKKDYSGKNQETYLLHQTFNDIQVLNNEESSEEDKKGALERLNKKAIESYEKNRVVHKDKRVDELVKQLDIVFGVPQRKYRKEPKIIVKEFVESLKKNKNYLLEIVDTEKLVSVYASYFERMEQEKNKKK